MVSSQWLPFCALLLASFAMGNKVPRLSPIEGKILAESEIDSLPPLSEDLETFYYTQTLDHFNYRPESFTTFQQKYVLNFRYWGGAKAIAPIFAYLGAESPLDREISVIGFINDSAQHFKGLQLYIEHRYYGESIPFGSREEALRNASIRGYFNSAQAIADYAEIILHIKEKLHAQHSPVIVVGGSYGGMLASWFRLKYPHIALGALASSAPVLYFDDITPQDGYYSVVTKDFREASEKCYRTIKKSWSVIEKVASEPGGLEALSRKFKTCKPLQSSSELTGYLEMVYASAAQYNRPPKYPVNLICGGIDAAPSGTDILTKIFAGLVAYKETDQPCYVNRTLPNDGWRWQTCSEMVIPIGIGKKAMLPPSPFNLTSYIEYCMSLYGVPPRPHWVTSYYGGHDIKLILQRFGSNIIFSNGLKDPYSSGGVLKNISDSIHAIYTVNGSHCLDILPGRESDPEWLTMQRITERKIIEGWITKYYADLKENTKS